MNEQQKKRPEKAAYPAWAPRFWHGMLLGDWMKLVVAHGGRIHPLRWGLACTITGATAFNSTMHLLDSAVYGRRVKATDIEQHPVFIVGHWRSGTTYLHELLSCDERFASPSTYQCFAANHFLLTESWIPRLFWFLMPSQRPMDNVQVGWNAPQEDEFALCSMGVPSPYLRIAFPNDREQYLDFLDLQHITPADLEQWKSCLRQFLQRLTCATGKRIILKSPTHTSRIGLLAEMFPQAKFLHIVRDPLTIFPSTVKLWRVLDEAQALQRPHFRELEEYIFRAFERMYEAFDEQSKSLATGALHELRYEDLIADPVGQLRQAYEQLDLGDFGPVEDRLASFASAKRDYRTNRYQIDDHLRQQILQRWGTYAAKYGYLDP